MIYYVFILIADVALAVQFTLVKMYQKTMGNSLKTGLVYNICTASFTALIFLALNRFQLEITPFSLIMALLLTTALAAYTLIGFKIITLGNVAIYVLFLMLGGMMLPFVYGLLFLGEAFKLLHIIGIVLLIAALLLSSRAGENKTEKQKGGKGLYMALCGVVFFLNGMVSIFSKVHQIETTAPKVSTQGFIILANLANLFLSSGILSVHLLGRNSSGIPVPWKSKFKIILGITLISAAIGGGSYMLQLIGAAHLPATVLYPMITGGSMVFTAIAAWAAFGEKLSFYTILSIFLAMAGTLMFL